MCFWSGVCGVGLHGLDVILFFVVNVILGWVVLMIVELFLCFREMLICYGVFWVIFCVVISVGVVVFKVWGLLWSCVVAMMSVCAYVILVRYPWHSKNIPRGVLWSTFCIVFLAWSYFCFKYFRHLRSSGLCLGLISGLFAINAFYI